MLRSPFACAFRALHLASKNEKSSIIRATPRFKKVLFFGFPRFPLGFSSSFIPLPRRYFFVSSKLKTNFERKIRAKFFRDDNLKQKRNFQKNSAHLSDNICAPQTEQRFLIFQKCARLPKGARAKKTKR